jgi:hypothetical protein
MRKSSDASLFSKLKGRTAQVGNPVGGGLFVENPHLHYLLFFSGAASRVLLRQANLAAPLKNNGG